MVLPATASSSPRRVGVKTLGVILPDDGPFDYEWLRLDGWLVDLGLGYIDLRVERSQADGIVAVTNLHHIGSPDVLLPPARRLVDGGAAAIVWACTSGSFVGGLDFARRQVELINADTGFPATSTALALIAAAKHLGAREIDLLSPYTEDITNILEKLLRDAGLSVVDVRSLGATCTTDSFDLDIRREVTEFAHDRLTRSYPILVPDTACNTIDLVEELEAEARRPVITANVASLWHGLRLLGDDSATGGVGQLFRPQTVPPG